MVLIDGSLIEVIVRFVGADLLREMVMVEQRELLIVLEEVARVNGVGVREQDEAVSVSS